MVYCKHGYTHNIPYMVLVCHHTVGDLDNFLEKLSTMARRAPRIGYLVHAPDAC